MDAMKFIVCLIIGLNVVYAVASSIITWKRKDNLLEDVRHDCKVVWFIDGVFTSNIALSIAMTFVYSACFIVAKHVFEQHGYVFEDNYELAAGALFLYYIAVIVFKVVLEHFLDLVIFITGIVLTVLLFFGAFKDCIKEEFEQIPFSQQTETIKLQEFPTELVKEKKFPRHDTYLICDFFIHSGTLYYATDGEKVDITSEKTDLNHCSLVYGYEEPYIKKTIYSRELVKNSKVVKSGEDIYFEIHIPSSDYGIWTNGVPLKE